MESAVATRRGITVLLLGESGGEAVDALRERFELEVRPAGLGARAALGAQQSVLRAAVNLAAWDWILLVRETERVSAELAREIAAATAEPPRAWGFRLRTATLYGGRPLRLRGHGPSSEIRLFHRRHVRFDLRDRRKEMNVEGAVVRLGAPLTDEAWTGPEEHRASLRRNAVPHSGLRRILLFVRAAVRHRALMSAPTLRYLWIEAGWDRGDAGASSDRSATR